MNLSCQVQRENIPVEASLLASEQLPECSRGLRQRSPVRVHQ
jgi:hypothetical protein